MVGITLLLLISLSDLGPHFRPLVLTIVCPTFSTKRPPPSCPTSLPFNGHWNSLTPLPNPFPNLVLVFNSITVPSLFLLTTENPLQLRFPLYTCMLHSCTSDLKST